ncbi:MAG: LysM peptidoglycan-binding domain-containing protein, partial [Rudaea sp.]
MTARAILRFPFVAAAVWVAGCASNPPAPVVDLSLPNENAPASSTSATPAQTTYHVVHGDTLYSIAFKHGLDFRDLAAWNGIASPYRILVGQDLRLSAPHAVQTIASAAPDVIEPQPGQAVTTGIADT